MTRIISSPQFDKNIKNHCNIAYIVHKALKLHDNGMLMFSIDSPESSEDRQKWSAQPCRNHGWAFGVQCANYCKLMPSFTAHAVFQDDGKLTQPCKQKRNKYLQFNCTRKIWANKS